MHYYKLSHATSSSVNPNFLSGRDRTFGIWDIPNLIRISCLRQLQDESPIVIVSIPHYSLLKATFSSFISISIMLFQ